MLDANPQTLADGYALLGALWLAIKVEGTAEDHAYRLAKLAAAATMVLLLAVSISALGLLRVRNKLDWFP